MDAKTKELLQKAYTTIQSNGYQSLIDLKAEIREELYRTYSGEWTILRKGDDTSLYPRHFVLVAVVETKGWASPHVACYLGQYEQEAPFDADSSDYNEEEDQNYLVEGWYRESCDSDGEALYIIDEPVVAWTTLPIYRVPL